MEYILTTTGLTKKYRKTLALKDINMHVPKGAIYGLVGENGAGKTTLIRIISGIQKQTSGEYTLFGRKSGEKDIEKSRKRIGAVVETPAIYTDMTAKENLLAQYHLLGITDYSDIDDILELVGLGNTEKKKAGNFSLGMKQRLGIAVALVGNPDLLILDEPINGLDPQGIIEIRELIIKLNREKQITVIISSHILDELSKLATDYGFVSKGKIVGEMSAESLEKQCRKCKRIVVSDMNIFSRSMDELGIEYTVISDTEADVFGEITVSDMVIAPTLKGCQVLSVENRDETLESFYINLIGGANNV